MDEDQTVTVWKSRYEQLEQENKQLKLLFAVVKENSDLRTSLHLFNNNTLETPSVCFRSGRNQFKTTLDEKQFSKHFNKTRLHSEHQTSSPTPSLSSKQSSACTDLNGRATSPSSLAAVDLEDNDSILGEIAYQLDRRILTYLFQGNKRHYGFTLKNIPDKIIEVSTNPITGKVDKGYQLYLSERYVYLMQQLSRLGYKKSLHPQFSEFIINTYGLLNEKSGEQGTRYNTVDYNNPETLKTLVITVAPVQLRENLLLLLSCLCKMAEKDKKPLLLI